MATEPYEAFASCSRSADFERHMRLDVRIWGLFLRFVIYNRMELGARLVTNLVL